MFGIFSDEPWFEMPKFPSLPEPGPWWDGLFAMIRETLPAVIGLASPGLAGGFVYAFLYDLPLLNYTVAFGFISFWLVYGLLYIIDTVRLALTELGPRIRGHVRPPRL